MRAVAGDSFGLAGSMLARNLSDAPVSAGYSLVSWATGAIATSDTTDGVALVGGGKIEAEASTSALL